MFHYVPQPEPKQESLVPTFRVKIKLIPLSTSFQMDFPPGLTSPARPSLLCFMSTFDVTQMSISLSSIACSKDDDTDLALGFPLLIAFRSWLCLKLEDAHLTAYCYLPIAEYCQLGRAVNVVVIGAASFGTNSNSGCAFSLFRFAILLNNFNRLKN